MSPILVCYSVYFSYLDIMIDTFGSIGAKPTTENADLPTETKNQIPGMAALRAFRVLRALKAISVIPGLKVRIISTSPRLTLSAGEHLLIRKRPLYLL